MAIITKTTTVYTASNGEDYATEREAIKADLKQTIWQHIRDNGVFPYDQADIVADAVVEHWAAIKAIMEAPVEIVSEEGRAAAAILEAEADDWGGANVARRETERALRPRCAECGHRFHHRGNCSQKGRV